MAFFSWSRWLRSLLRPSVKTIRKLRRRTQLRLEPLELRLAPAVFTWTGQDGTSWSDAKNWLSNGVHTAPTGVTGTDDLVFPAGAVNTTANNDITPAGGGQPIFNSITISGAGYTLNGLAIQLGKSAIVNGQTGFITVNAPAGSVETLGFKSITLGGGADSGQQDFSTAAFNTLTINSTLISGTANKGLKAVGNGEIILTAANLAFSEPLTVVGGIVQIQNAQALGSGNTTTVDANAQLQLNSLSGTPLTINEPLILNGQGTHNDGALLNVSGNNLWSSGASSSIVLGTATPSVFIGAAAGTTLTVAAQISDQGSGTGLTKVGGGTLVLTNNNTYRNLTDVENGVLSIQNANALGNYQFGNKYNLPVHVGNVIVNDNTVALTFGTLEIDDEADLPGTPGMVIQNENLIVNGPGYNGVSPGAPVIGGLHNLRGNNTWTGSVTLGGTINPQSPWIGVEAGTDLLLSGVLGDPSNAVTNGGPFSLNKFLPGKLILTNDNTYLGTTNVVGGILNVEDSRALGPDNKINPFTGLPSATNVSAGAELDLQLQTDNVDQLVPVPALDSETGRSNQMVFQQVLNLFGGNGVGGVNGGGALQSISGINAWEAPISSFGAGIGVLPDPHQANSQLYFPLYDTSGHAVSGEYSLTVGTPQGVTGFPGTGSGAITGSIVKLGAGHLILPQSNAISADIEQGWITIETATSIQGAINVAAGAALHLKPLPGTSMQLNNDITLNGDGIDHRFGLINHMGALENLDGINSLIYANGTGIVHLNGQAGIGVENVFGPGNFFGTPGVFGSASQLTISSYVWDGTLGGVTAHGGIDKLGSDRLIMSGLGTYTGPVDIRDGVFLAQSATALGAGNTPFATTTVEPGQNTILTLDFLNPVPNSTKYTLTLNNVPVINQVTGTPTFTFTGNPNVDVVTLQTSLQAALAAIPGAAVSVTVPPGSPAGQYQITFGGTLLTHNQQLSSTVTGGGTLTVVTQQYGSGTALEIANSFPNQIVGGNLYSETGGVAGGIGIWAEHLILSGTGDPNFNDKGALTVLSANDFANQLGPYQDPLFPTDNLWNGPITLKAAPPIYLAPPNTVTVYVPPQSRITLFGPIGDGGANVNLTVNGQGEVDLAGANTYGGMTNINSGVVTIENSQALGSPGIGAVQTINVSALTAGPTTTYSVSFNGSAAVSVPYTGVTQADTTALINALNGLSTIGGGSVNSNIGGSVSVTEDPANPGVFTVTFGGSMIGFAQPNIQSTTTGVTIQTVTPGTGGTIISHNAQLQLAGRITVSNEPLLVIGNGDPNLSSATPTAPTLPTQWFPVGPAPEANGQNLGNTDSVGGRITGIANLGGGVLYVATAGGGVWKTIDNGNSWRPVFDSIPDLETLVFNPSGTAIQYTLSFTGKDATGATVTDSTDPNNPLVFDPANIDQSMQDIQNALDAFSNIGGVGGVVTVTQSGPNTLLLTFGGVAMAGNNVTQQLTATPITTGSSVTDVVVEPGSQPVNSVGSADPTSTAGLPFAAMYIGAITWDPGNGPNGTLYVGTGEANTSPDSYYGTGLYQSTDGGITWSVVADLVTSGTTTPFNPLYGQAINKIAFDPNAPQDLYVATTTLVNGPPLPNMPTTTPASVQHGDGTAPTGPDAFKAPLAGIWRFATVNGGTGPTWYNMTDWTTAGRATLQGQNHPPAPNTPGPDDDFRVSFDGQADWTDVQVIDTVTANNDVGPGLIVPVVYAALGNPTGLQELAFGNFSGNGIYRCENPLNSPPSWDLGDHGALKDEVQEITYTNGPGAGLYTLAWEGSSTAGHPGQVVYQNDVSQLNVFNGLTAALNEIIGPGRWSATDKGFDINSDTIDVTFIGNLSDSPQPLIQVVKEQGVTIKVSDSSGGGQQGGGFDNESSAAFNTLGNDPSMGNLKLSVIAGPTVATSTVYASAANFTNQSLLGVYVSTTGGLTWKAVGTQPNNYMGNEGAYDNAIVAFDANTVFVGGTTNNVIGATAYQNMVFYTTNGGSTWTDESTSGGVSPHTAIHALVPDGSGGVLAGTDGGLFDLNLTATGAFQWLNLNGNVDAANLNIQSISSVVPGPTDPSVIYAGSTNNGLEVFNAFMGSQPWQGTMTWNEITDPNNGNVVGASTLLVDPNNPLNMYEVQDQFSQYNGEGGPDDFGFASNPALDEILYRSTNGGTSWTQILTMDKDAPLPVGNDNLAPPLPEWDAGAPMVMDQINTNRILVGAGYGNDMFGNFNAGGVWETTSASGAAGWIDLGGPSQPTAIALAQYQGVFQADPRFIDASDVGANTYVPDTIYSSDGTNVWVTKDHGQIWATSTPGGSGTIVDVEVDPRNSNVVYAVRNGFGTPAGGQVWVSTDGAQTWTQIGGNTAVDNLPNARAWKLVIDPRNGNLYLGTDLGVYQLPYGSNQWQRFGTGMPNVEVKDLQLNQITNVLVAGTYGRGAYELFLDPQQTAAPLTPTTPATPVIGAVVALSGQPVWAGPVILGNDGSGTVTIGATGNPILANGVSVAQLNIVGQISDQTLGATVELDKVGTGNLVLSGQNVYGGLTNIKQGVIIVDNPQALGLTTGGTVVQQYAALQLESSVDAEPLTLNGDGPTAFFNVINPALSAAPSIPPEAGFDGHNTGALESIANVNVVVFAGPITLASNSTIGVGSGSTLTITGNISEIAGTPATPKNLTKELAGTLILDDTNSYTGETYINQGILQVASSGALSSSIITPGPQVTLLDGAQIQVAANVTVKDSLSLSGSGINDSGALLGVGTDAVWAGNITLDANPGFSVLTDPLGTVAFAALLGDILTVTGVIGDEAAFGLPSGVSVVGQGTVVFAGANTYAGGTYVNSPSTFVLANTQGAGGMASESTETVQDAIQRINIFDPSFNGLTSTGNFSISYNGDATPALSTTSSPDTVRDAIATLLGLPTGPGSPVSVTVSDVTTPASGSTAPTPTLTEFIYTVVFDALQMKTLLGNIDIGQLFAQGEGNVLAKTSVVSDGGVGVLVRDGGTLGLNLPSGSTVSGVALQLNGTGVGGFGALQNVGQAGNTVTWGGPNIKQNPAVPAVTLGTASKANANGNFIDAIGGNAGTNITLQPLQGALPLDGPIYAELAKVGPGTLTLPTANTYLGTTDVRDGVLSVANSGSLGAKQSDEFETIKITGSLNSTFDLTLDGVQIATAVSTNWENGTATLDQLNAELQGLATVTQSGPVYTIDFNGTFNGQSIAGKPVDLVQSDNSSVAPAELIHGGIGGTFVDSSDELQTINITGPLTDTFDLTLDGVSIAKGISTDYLNGTATLNQLNTALLGLATVTQSSIVPSQYIIDFNGSFQGQSLAGKPVDLVVSDDPNVTTAEALHGNDGTLQLTGSITYNSGESLTLNSLGFNPGTGSLGALESTPNGATPNVWSNPVVLASNSTIGVDPVSPNPPPGSETPAPVGLILNQQISGPAGFDKINQGTLQITNLLGVGSNNYGGTTTVTDGLVLLNDNNGAVAIPGPLVVGDNTSHLFPIVQLQGDNQIAFGGNQPVTVNADGFFDINGHNQTLAQLNINDGIAQTGTKGTLTLTPNATVGAVVLTMTSGLLNLNTNGTVNLGGDVIATSDPNETLPLTPAATIVSDPNSSTGAPTGTFNVASSTGSNIFTVNFPSTTPATTAATDLVDLDIKVPLSVSLNNQIVKQGPGRMELDADNSATMQSALLVNNGDVQVDGIVNDVSLFSTTGNASVGGNGFIGSVDGGTGSTTPIGSINPGNNGSGSSKTGTLHIGSGNTMTWGQDPTSHNRTTLSVDLTNLSNVGNPGGTPQPGLDYDVLNVNGQLNLGGSGPLNTNGTLLAGTVDPTVITGNTFTIITTTPGSTITGRFFEPYGDDVNPSNPNNPYGIDFINGAKFDVAYLPASAGPNGPFTAVELIRAQETVTTFQVTSPIKNGQSIYGQDVQFTGNVVLDGGFGIVPPGDQLNFVVTNTANNSIVFQKSVSFQNGAPVFDPQLMNNGKAIDVGSYKVTMTLVPDPNIADPGTATYTFGWTVNPDDTSTTLTPPGSALWGVPATVTASVAAVAPPGGQIPGAQAPQGTVNFIVDNTITIPGTLSGGLATAPLPANLAIGLHSIKAAYVGVDADYNPSNASNSATLTVTKDNSQAQVGTVGGSTPVYVGQPTTFQALITPIAPATQTPLSGDIVKFIDAATNTALGTVTLNNITVTFQNALGDASEALLTADATGLTGTSPSVTASTIIGGSATTNAIQALAFGGTITGGTFTLTYTNSLGAKTITGPITWSANDQTLAANIQQALTTSLGSGNTLVGYDTAYLAVPSLAVGAHKIEAQFLGDTFLNPNNPAQGALSFTINKIPTTTTLTSSANPAVYQSQLQLTATVTALNGLSGGTGTLFGVVDFYDGSLSKLIGAGNLTTTSPSATVGTAVVQTNSLTATGGTLPHNIFAVYQGDPDYAGSQTSGSANLSQEIQYGDTTTVTVVPSPTVTYNSGQSFAITATVATAANTPAGNTISGTVTFYDTFNGVTSQLPSLPGAPNPAQLVNGQAVYAIASLTSQLPIGQHQFSAQFTDSNATSPVFISSNDFSSPATEYVLSQTTTTVTSSTGASAAGFGAPVTFYATVAPIAPGTGTPANGTVQFIIDGVSVGSPVPLGSDNLGHTGYGTNVAAYVTNSLALTINKPNHTVAATYSGDNTNYASSNGTLAGGEAVYNDDSVTLNVSTNTIGIGLPVTLTATVTPLNTTNVPTGTVTFYDGTTAIAGPFNLSAIGQTGQTTPITVTLNTLGNHPITAVYNFNLATGFIGNTSAVQNVFVEDTTATTLSVSSTTAQPYVFGQNVTLAATVANTSNANGPVAPTGTVTFQYTIGTTVTTLGSVNYPAFNSIQTTALPVGTNYTISAVYTSNNTPPLYTSTSAGTPVIVNPDDTNTIVSSSDQSSAVYSELLTLTATVQAASPGSGVPTGTVQFSVDGTNVGSPVNVQPNGQATLPLTTALTATGSPHAIKAIYTPSIPPGGTQLDYKTSTGTLSQAVAPDDTNTTVSSSATNNTAVYGQAVTLSATVAAAGLGVGVPLGTVQFSIDGGLVTSSAITLVGGVAKFVVPTQLSIGGSPHSVTATYAPGTTASAGNFNPGSGTLTTGLNVIADNTSTVVTASTGGTTTRANAAVFGETVTFTATVSPTAPGVATPTGNMQFSVDNGAVISVPLGQDNLGHTGFASNVALFVTSSLSVTPGGTLHNIVASFVNVDGNFNDSSNVANPLQIQVNGAGTNTAVSLTASSAVYSAPATLVATVTVNGLGSGTPTGTVQFMDTNTGNPIGGPVTLGTNGNPANVASLDISTITPLLDVGTYNVEAVYSGDANFAGSDNTSQPPPTLAITRDGTTTTLKSSDLSAVFTEQVTLTAVVTPTTPGTAIAPNTTVNFLDGTKVIGSGTVAFDAANGVYDATYTTTTFAVGTHLLKAQFLGNADDAASGTATAISQKVAVAPTSIVGITASDSTGDPNGDPTYFGQTATFTATVAANAPATGTPSGTVTFKDNGVAITGGTVSLIGNTALFATSSLAVLTAPHNITAVYNGKLGAYAASTTSPTLQHTVFSALTSVTLTGPAGIVLGSPVPFTATVAVTAPGAGNVVGTVQFKVTDPSTGNLIIASPGQAIVGGVAHWSGWVPGIALGPGSYNVTVSYNPGTSLSFAPSSSTKTLTAGYRTTATISTTAPTGVIVGNPFTLATTVTSGPVTAGGKLVTLPTMTGTVTFVDTISGQPVSPAIPVSALSGNAAGTIQKGTVSFQVTSLPVGNYNIVARYSGDANYAPVTTAAISEGVFTAPASISATLVKAPLGVGSLFTVAVKVYDANGNQILLSTGNATIIEIAGPVGGFTPHTVAFNNKTGMFTFSGLTVSKSSGYTPYTLQITFDNLTTTISFSVTGRVS